MSLKKMPDVRYQLFVVDAFSGDSVPVHLMTVQAIKLYRSRLAHNGIILFHTSNRYIRYDAVLAKTAFAAGAYVYYKDYQVASTTIFPSTWIAVAWDKLEAEKLVSELDWERIDPAWVKKIRPWTDQSSTILPFIRSEGALGGDR